MTPRAEYLQEVGRDLVIPCQANGDPVPNITWSKVRSHQIHTGDTQCIIYNEHNPFQESRREPISTRTKAIFPLRKH